jgi:integrase
MAAKLTKSKTPGVYRRHASDCLRRGRCECSYVVVWRYRGKQYTDTFRTLTEAREAKANRDAGDRRPVARTGLEDYFKSWIRSYGGRTAGGFAEKSRKLYRRAIELYALREWGTWKLAEVEPVDVRRRFSQLRDDEVSTTELRLLRAALSAMFATAIEDGLIRANPVQGVRIPAAPTDDGGEAKALKRAELAIVLKALPVEWRLFFEFLTHTGLRISEAIGLTWANLDLGTTPRVCVREQVYEGERQQLKSRHSRRDVPMSAGMVERLWALRRDTYRGDTFPVFASVTGTEVSRPNVAGRVLKPAVKAVGLDWVSFHTFRHTCASLLFDGGKNVKQVQEWLATPTPDSPYGPTSTYLTKG